MIEIASSDAWLSMQPTPTEVEACKLRWTKVEGKDTDIPAEEAVRLLYEIRERMASLEQEAVQALQHSVSEGRRVPRRRLVFAFAVIGVLLVLAALALKFMEMFSG